jgi:hypothetical protein
MRFIEFKVGDELLTDTNDINKILQENNLSWLIDSEVEDAKIEIKNKTLIWHDGTYNAGDWYYGIWKNGYFYGTWENGIWECGDFNGKWKSGIK